MAVTLYRSEFSLLQLFCEQGQLLCVGFTNRIAQKRNAGEAGT